MSIVKGLDRYDKIKGKDLKRTDCPRCNKTYQTLEGNFHRNKNVNRGYNFVCISCVTKVNVEKANKKMYEDIKREKDIEMSLKKRLKLNEFDCDRYLKASHSIASKSIVHQNLDWSDIKKILDREKSIKSYYDN